MATVYKILFQSAPAATTTTYPYTVPSATTVVTSKWTICNRGSTATTFRIAIRLAGVALTDSHYMVYDAPIAANDSIVLPGGDTLSATDIVTVYAGNANLTFTLHGSEIS